MLIFLRLRALREKVFSVIDAIALLLFPINGRALIPTTHTLPTLTLQ